MKIYIFLLLCCCSLNLFAEDKEAYLTTRSELRIGWGDQLFESLVWHDPVYIVQTMNADYTQIYHENYSYGQHLWLEYQWRFKYWLSFGAMMDVSHVGWDDVIRDGRGNELSRTEGRYFYNLVFMPTLRFTYYHHPNVNLYSAVGLGLDINGGTEMNTQGQFTDLGAALNMTVFGVSANYQRWFVTLDFGGLSALKNFNTIFLATSRIINVSVGARF